MHHERFLLNIAEWISEEHPRPLSDAMAELTTFLTARGYRSLELELAELARGFLGVRALVTQSVIASASRERSATARRTPQVFTTCLRREDALLFIDIERRLKDTIYVEIDVFTTTLPSLRDTKEAVTEDLMKCFGLTKSKETLLRTDASNSRFMRKLRGRLVKSKPLSDALFQHLRDEKERGVLRELKKRGSILERDLHELSTSPLQPEQVKRTLDYLSGDEYQLIDRRYAIVCHITGEIIFLMDSKEDIEAARNLACPKCASKLGSETVMPYYGVTEKLKQLLDGNHWMPLLVRDALLRAGVPEDDIYTEVKYGEDEIDLLIFHGGRILAMEVKDRSVSLNDAYKLSAKTSRIESVVGRLEAGRPEDADPEPEDVPMVLRYGLAGEFLDSLSPRARGGRESFTPIVISTHDIAKDARDLLTETKQGAQFLESCEGKLDSFVSQLIGEINEDELRRRLSYVASTTTSDSAANLAAVQLWHAFSAWQQEQKGG